jgi:hypothetical protein
VIFAAGAGAYVWDFVNAGAPRSEPRPGASVA